MTTRSKEQRLSDMAHYMTDDELYVIEGMDHDEALKALAEKFGEERVDQLIAIAG